MEQLKIQEKVGANYVLLEISGAIDSYSFKELQLKLFELIRETNVVLDLEEVTAMDSSGLTVILGTFNLGEDFGRKLYILQPSPEAKKAIDSTGFSSLLRIINTITEVL